MSRPSAIVNVFEQHAQRRAAGKPTPNVLVGGEAVEAWAAFGKGRRVVRSTAIEPEDAARAYLDDAGVCGALEERLEARVQAARTALSLPKDKTAYELEVWVEVSLDALLGAGDTDGHLLLGYVHAGAATPLRAFAAAVRVFSVHAAALLVELPPERLDAALRVAIALVEAAPSATIAVATTAEAWRAWQDAPGREHAKAMVRPYAVEPRVLEDAKELGERARETGCGEDEEAARSAAERALFEALELHPTSHGCFALNQRLPVHFGHRPLEIDLASTSLRLAVEVDGYFHFQDPDAYRRDRRKDVVLQREGYFVVRVLAEDVTARLEETVSSIHEVMAFLSGEQRAEEKS